MKTLTWQKPGQQNVAQELIKIIINYVAELRFDKKGIKDLKIFTRKPDYFLLVLIRGDYYNGAYTGFDGPPTINLRNNKFSFYKIAIPCYLK